MKTIRVRCTNPSCGHIGDVGIAQAPYHLGPNDKCPRCGSPLKET